MLEKCVCVCIYLQETFLFFLPGDIYKHVSTWREEGSNSELSNKMNKL